MGEAGGMKMNKSFTGILGESPTVKMWEFLLLGRNFEYHIKDIANGAGISRPTCHAELKKMQQKRLVVKGGKHKGKQLYKLNKKSPIARAMIRAFHNILYN